MVGTIPFEREFHMILLGHKPVMHAYPHGSPCRYQCSRNTALHVLSSGRQPWDVGRFLKTVVYFNDPAKALQELASAPARLLSSFPGQQQQQVGILLFAMCTAVPECILLAAGKLFQ